MIYHEQTDETLKSVNQEIEANANGDVIDVDHVVDSNAGQNQNDVSDENQEERQPEVSQSQEVPPQPETGQPTLKFTGTEGPGF
jgi:hypothetical protein